MDWVRQRFGLVMIGLLWGGLVTLGQTATAPDALDRAKQVYAEHQSKIKAAYQKSHNARIVAYRAALHRLQEAAQARGELEHLQAVIAEQQRFIANPVVHADNLSEQNPQLKEMQGRFLTACQDAASERDRQMLSLTREFAAHVSKLQQQFTQEGEIALAIDCKNEVDRATFEIDLLVSEKIEAQDAETASDVAEVPPKTDDPPPDVLAQTAITPSPDGTESGTCMVYLGSGKSVPGLQLKTLALRRSSRARVARGALVNASIGEIAKSATAESSSYYYYYSAARRYAESTIVRTQVRCLEPRQNVTVIIQLFTKNVARRGNIAPSRMGIYRTTLAIVDRTGITIDCPPISTSRIRNKGAYFSSGDNRGTEFYGALVTVFDKDSEILYEGLSAPSLEEMADQTGAELTREEKLRLAREQYEQRREAYFAACRETAGALHDRAAATKRDEAYTAYQAAQRAYYELRNNN